MAAMNELIDLEAHISSDHHVVEASLSTASTAVLMLGRISCYTFEAVADHPGHQLQEQTRCLHEEDEAPGLAQM